MTGIVEKKRVVIDFLEKCNQYADGMMNKYESQLVDDPDAEESKLKLLKWQSYKEFNEYAINELESDDLDDWFTD